MQAILQSIWSALGVPQLLGLILTLIVIAAAFLVQLFINRAMNRGLEKLKVELQGTIEDKKAELQKTIEDQKFVQSQYAGIVTYVHEQYSALFTAYLRLFEGEGATATGKAFAKIALKVKDNIMAPFRQYQPLLDQQTFKNIYFFHNILAQVQDNPSPDDIERFRSLRVDFLKAIYDSRDILRPERILKEMGIIG